MFDIGSSELLLIVVVAILVIGPKDLPRALYKMGQIIGKARGMARHFRTGLDAMVREAELEELQKQWAKENERIMRETQIPDPGGTMTPLADESAALPPPSGEQAAAETPPLRSDPGPAAAPGPPAGEASPGGEAPKGPAA